MPVVYVPGDTRWSDLGKGIGQLAGQTLQAYQMQQAAKGVAEIMQDTSISDDDKPVQALKRGGDLWYKMYNQQQESKLRQQQIESYKAELGGKVADTAIKRIQQQHAQAMQDAQVKKEQADADAAAGRAPYAGPQAAATATSLQAKAAEDKALVDSRIAAGQSQARVVTGTEKGKIQEGVAAGAVAEATSADRIKGAAGVAKSESAAGELAEIQLNRLKESLLNADTATGGTTPAQLQKILGEKFGITDPADQQLGLAIYQNAHQDYLTNPTKVAPNAGMDALVKWAAKRKDEQAQAFARAGGQVPPKDIEKVKADAGYAEAAGTLVEEIKQHPEQFGPTSSIRQFFSRLGLDNDPELVRSGEQVALLRAEQAMKSGSFLSTTSSRIAADISPSLDRSAIPNMIQINAVARQKVAEYGMALTGIGKNSLINPDPYNKSLETFKKIANDTEYRQLAFDNPKSPDGVTRVHVLGGNQVDPITLRPLVEADKVYGGKEGKTTGADIIAKAQYAAEHAGERRTDGQGVIVPFDPYQFLVAHGFIKPPAGSQ